ncbi:glycosyltransferase family 32 protein [Lentinula detonsa]|uniref:Glycosyltransferase family 32 protein n=1 Tax=Lentinula detonsa TaxID=2804962 RepID=A0AA38Q5C9_9AGAR|nr:glycosyltransferase family 32 protein [Lentinula detonsa]
MTRRRQSHLPLHIIATDDSQGNSRHKHGWAVFNSCSYPRHLYVRLLSRLGRKRANFVLAVLFAFVIFVVLSLQRNWDPDRIKNILPFTADSPTLVYRKEDLQRIWAFEIESGHFPSTSSVPEQIGLKGISNPGLPPLPDGEVRGQATRGTGFMRVYPEIQHNNLSIAFPPRPAPGSIADLDVVKQHCDFSSHKLVRDCLEVLRVGAGLDNGNRLRRENLDDWKYIYLEQSRDYSNRPHVGSPSSVQIDSSPETLLKKAGSELESSPIDLPTPSSPLPFSSLSTACDPDYPRIFHMYWTGPFTDKPYMAILSFLYTQKTGLHLYELPKECRPVFWVWINPVSAASTLGPNAVDSMHKELQSNPWASPFLHDRFKDVLQFKLWNTTQQLDAIPELRNEWRKMHTLFNTGGRIVNVPPEDHHMDMGSHPDDMFHRTGSKSSSSYDRLSVILSDMARFVLCHRFGGIYLDADTILLRDWEEVWGWRGGFAYRWSRLPRYNTAVLHMNKGSAIGTFLFRTALKNNLDFHPMTITRYLKDAYLDGLLLQLPDALFDSAWLNTENYQRERPPQPFFKAFQDFFDTPAVSSAAPLAMGFDGFFRGAFSYHYHNFWWKPFDPSRNWPDLGGRFSAGEEAARKLVPQPINSDREDLSWSAVLKRTFESYIRGERCNMYGEWLRW